MRLKARFRDPVTFLRIMQTMSKLSSRCILRFSPERVVVVVPRGTDSVEAWAEIDEVKMVFDEYAVESNHANEVNLEVASEMLCQALKLTTSASRVTMKLAKRGAAQPVLNLDIATSSPGGQDVVVTHEVLISVKKPREVVNIRSAEDASSAYNFVVQSSFPDLAEVRVVAERMRTLDAAHNRLVLSANMLGELKISMKGEAIDIETHWTDVLTDEEKQNVLEQHHVSNETRKRFRRVHVDTRAFVKLLGCQMTDYSVEMWIAPKTCAAFLIHAHKIGSVKTHDYVAHIMVILPNMSSGYDD